MGDPRKTTYVEDNKTDMPIEETNHYEENMLLSLNKY